VSTKCLVVCDNELMIVGLRALLAKQVALEVFSLSDHIGEEMAQTMTALHPDVVLVDEDMGSASPAELLKALRLQPGLRVIVFNERDNQLTVYHDMQFEIGQVQNLVDVILNHSFHPRND
jgi:DNA-binding NarL/FixJ family response regulator